jgi:ABC-type xylose transport system permease subunit
VYCTAPTDRGEFPALASRTEQVIGAGTEQATIERSHRAPLLGAFLAVLLMAWALMTPGGFGAAQAAGWFTTATPLALAAMAQTPVLLAGGQGLAAGGTAILASVITAGFAGVQLESALVAGAPAIGVSALIGATNGWLIGRLGLRSTIVTLATGAATLAVSLWLLEVGPPGPPDSFRAFLAGEASLGAFPAPALLLVTVAIALRKRANRLACSACRHRSPVHHPTRRRDVCSPQRAPNGSPRHDRICAWPRLRHATWRHRPVGPRGS